MAVCTNKQERLAVDLLKKLNMYDYFEYTAQFCHLYDQCAFDPNYESMSLDDFEPMVHRVLNKPKNSIYKH